MTGFTYELTSPAALELHRQQQARARAALAQSVERVKQLTQRMGAKFPQPARRPS